MFLEQYNILIHIEVYNIQKRKDRRDNVVGIESLLLQRSGGIAVQVAYKSNSLHCRCFGTKSFIAIDFNFSGISKESLCVSV